MGNRRRNRNVTINSSGDSKGQVERRPTDVNVDPTNYDPDSDRLLSSHLEAIDRLLDFYKNTSFRAILSSDQSTLLTTNLDVIFDDDDVTDANNAVFAWDNGNNYNTTTGEYTVSKDGEYIFEAMCRLSGIAAGNNAFIAIFINAGSGYARRGVFQHSIDDATHAHSFLVTLRVKLKVGDLVKVTANSDSDNSWVIEGSGAGDFTWFQGRKVAEI